MVDHIAPHRSQRNAGEVDGSHSTWQPDQRHSNQVLQIRTMPNVGTNVMLMADLLPLPALTRSRAFFATFLDEVKCLEIVIPCLRGRDALIDHSLTIYISAISHQVIPLTTYRRLEALLSTKQTKRTPFQCRYHRSAMVSDRLYILCSFEFEPFVKCCRLSRTDATLNSLSNQW